MSNAFDRYVLAQPYAQALIEILGVSENELLTAVKSLPDDPLRRGMKAVYDVLTKNDLECDSDLFAEIEIVPTVPLPTVTPVTKKQKILEKLQVLRSENKKLTRQKYCRTKNCSNLTTLTFLPCGHFCYCIDCGTSFDACPCCRKTILADVRTFLA